MDLIKRKMRIMSAGTRAEDLGHKWLVINPIPDNECCIELVGELFMRTPKEQDTAHRLVKYWNCHDELLKACEKLLYNAELMAMTVGVEQARQAIKKATA